jgi:DNA-directed RNA polymerase specialized sigma24 family protein
MEKSKEKGISVRNLQEIDAAVNALFRDQKYGLVKFINSKLYRYRLHSYEANDIFSDAIVRAIAYLENNDEIPNIVGWLKKTCHNIIREESRKEEKKTALIRELRKADNFMQPMDTSKFSSDAIRLAKLLTESLSEREQTIIFLMANELSWREICIHLSEKGLLAKESATEPRTIERIKKQGNRTASKLRNLIKEAEKLNK